MSTIFLIAVILFIIFGPTLLAALFEKRMVWPYGPIGKDGIDAKNMRAGDDEKINNYLIRYINDAMGKGFEYLGCFNDAKGSKYKVVYHALVSPDNYTLAIIGGGNIIGIKVWGTWLYSQSDNEHCYYTVDNQSGIDKDLSKLWHDQLVFADDFATLYEKHQKWIQANAVSLKIYPSGGELEEYRRARRYRFDYMEKLGYLRYLGNDKEYWKYTLLGAIKFSFLGIVIGTFRHIKAGKRAR
jgi:hypothetical protein